MRRVLFFCKLYDASDIFSHSLLFRLNANVTYYHHHLSLLHQYYNCYSRRPIFTLSSLRRFSPQFIFSYPVLLRFVYQVLLLSQLSLVLLTSRHRTTYRVENSILRTFAAFFVPLQTIGKHRGRSFRDRGLKLRSRE